MIKKERVGIPPGTAAKVLFGSDRTCCVCRQKGKPVQIHHIDEDPANNEPRNLAVLCFDCHRDTQIRGGFDRKLDAEQVILYRDDWHNTVARARIRSGARSERSQSSADQLELATSIAEIYRESGEYELLALHYEGVGNAELRDKYVDMALARETDDQTVVFLRGLQKRTELIPADVIDRVLKRYADYPDPLQRARFMNTIGRKRESVQDYLDGLAATLREGNLFSTAFYLKELAESGLVNDLFVLAFQESVEEKDLWWQVRALQELGWQSELRELLLSNADEIASSDNPDLQLLLANARGDRVEYVRVRKEMAKNEHMGVYEEDDTGPDETAVPDRAPSA